MSALFEVSLPDTVRFICCEKDVPTVYRPNRKKLAQLLRNCCNLEEENPSRFLALGSWLLALGSWLNGCTRKI
jgi:hypothetical protein